MTPPSVARNVARTSMRAMPSPASSSQSPPPGRTSASRRGPRTVPPEAMASMRRPDGVGYTSIAGSNATRTSHSGVTGRASGDAPRAPVVSVVVMPPTFAPLLGKTKWPFRPASVRIVPPRRYDQFCGLARALEIVGERWTLLVVRDLLDGPKRYGDLLEGLAPIATDVLAGRLRELEAAGIVTREPGRSYALTQDGFALVPALDALARWGLRRLERRPDDIVRPRWLGMAVRSLVRRDRPGVDLVVRLDVPEGSAALHITEAAVTEVAQQAGEA